MFKNLESIFCLSLDLELLIGWHDLPNSIYENRKKELENVRDRIYKLINVLEKNKIRCTWGVTSHLFLEKCDGHDDYPNKEWLLRDPRTGVKENPLWYAPDLINRLLQSDVDFEIGCHGFSHAIFSDIEENQAGYELRMSRDLVKDWGIELKSFIFPRNKEGHKKILAEFRYTAYRPRIRIDYKPKIIRALDLLLARGGPGPVVPMIDEYGMVKIPPSICLEYESLLHKIFCKSPPRDTFRRYMESGLERTVSQGGVFHVWMHPCEYGKCVSQNDFEYLINLVKKYETEGKLRILTMSQIAQKVCEIEKQKQK